METEILVNSKAESPNLPVIELKVQSKEENYPRLDKLKLEVASHWLGENEKNVNYYENFHGEDSEYKFKEPKSLGNVVDEKDNLGKKQFCSFCIKGSCTEHKTGIFKMELDESNISLVNLSGTIEQEEINIKDEGEEDKLDKKTHKPGKSQCPECPYRTIYKHSLKIHYSIKHKKPDEINWYSCQVCPYKSAYKFHLKRHSVKHKRPEEVDWYMCQKCPYKTSQKNHLKSHVLIHNNLMLKCSKCSYETLRATSLKRHQIKHKTDVEWLQCSECSYKTYQQSDFRRHSLVHNTAVFKCPNCPYQTGRKDQLSIHQVKHESMDKWYSCALCPFKTYYTKCMLTRHSRQQHGIDPNNSKQIKIFKCTECSYESGCKNTMKIHQLKHDLSNWFQCPDCTYKTPYKNLLKKHQLQHQEENVKCWHRCLECPYKNLDKANLEKHLISHISADKIKWFECAQCDFKTVRKNNLKQHKLKHKEAHEVEWFYCHECSHKTKYKSSLVGHISRHKKRIKG